MKSQRVSIKDIAKAAGVSHPTVSRALRGEGRMGDDTRQRIVSLAREMGYTPSLVARGLVTQRSKSVGMVVTDLADPFHSEIARGVEETAVNHGYSLYLASCEIDAEREYEVVRSFQGRQVDGIIVSSSRVGDLYGDLLQETGIPIVLINNHADGSNMYAVQHDDYTGACALSQHLIERGFQRIAYLGNGRAGRANSERMRGWQDTLERAGHENYVSAMSPNGRLSGGWETLPRLLAAAAACWQTVPDAIMCYNDMSAIGALHHLRDLDLLAPEDVALTGFDDVEFSAYTSPPLTTWRQPRFEMGEEAMQKLLALLDARNGTEVQRVTTLQGRLVVRESTHIQKR